MSDLPRPTRTAPAARPGIVHFGPGAFFRAFNAVYTDNAMAAGGGDWGIVAVSLKSPTARDQLAPQDGVFTAVELAPEGARPRLVHAVTRVLVAPEDPAAVLAALRDPGVRVVSLTITEKGYCHEPASGRLRRDHPDIAQDLETPGAPASAAGFIVEALRLRRADGTPPFTVLSCDNLPSNGALARATMLDFARARDAGLAEWIAAEVPFPATMVDRITPATTAEDVARLAEAEGYHDPACVQHEPFRQWVIEDRFAGARPAWEAAGAQFVDSVEAHETMKLRCLNGAHSTLAYLGYLAGHETIAETVADPAFAALLRRLWRDEILPTVPQPEGEDLAAYTEALLRRFANPAIRHRTWQIAMDGSQKLPQRLLATAAEALAAGRPVPGLALAVAGWMRYVGGVDEAGGAIDVRDPLAERLRAASDGAGTPEDTVAALLALRDVFPAELAATPAFRAAVTEAYRQLAAEGARAAVLAYAG
ncbi:mannitol dehydrogenase family protein [Roseivivax sp. CAU 1761]